MSNKPFHIILADDDEGDRLIFREAMKELDIELYIQTMNNGKELMDCLTEQNAQLPHLIFLDLNMPRKNGFECLKEIRSNEKLKNIPIAIYSTSDNENDVEEAFLKGANVYIAKPDDFNTLKQLLNKAVNATRLFHGNTFNITNFLLRV